MGDIILSRFLNTYGTHQDNAGSSEIFLDLNNSATSIELDFFS